MMNQTADHEAELGEPAEHDERVPGGVAEELPASQFAAGTMCDLLVDDVAAILTTGSQTGSEPARGWRVALG